MFKCADLKTGELKFKERLEPRARRNWSSPVMAGGGIYLVAKEGGTHVIAAEPEFKILAHNTIDGDGGPWIATPAICRGQLYLRSRTHFYCIGNKTEKENLGSG